MSTKRTLLLLAILFFGVVSVRPVEAAGPRLMIAYGKLLKKRIILSDWNENQQLMLSITEGANVEVQSLKGRPYVELLLFWGPEWIKYVEEGKPVEVLKPDQANQRARFYPAVGRRPAIWAFDKIKGPGPLTRSVTSEGIEILKRHNIPTALRR